MSARFSFWQRWLTGINILFLFVGLLVALFPDTPLMWFYHDAVTTNFGEAEPYTNPEVIRLRKWLWGIIGGTLVGFHVFAVALSEYPIRKRERWAHTTLGVALLSWFIIDSGMCLVHGAYFNILLINLPALVGIGLPLLMLRRFMEK